MGASKPENSPSGSGMARIVDRNIHALIDRRRQEERRQSTSERVAALVSGFAGSMFSVWAHGVIVAAWTLINLRVIPGVPAFDPTFVLLATTASVEAIFLSTFVLIQQNKMAALADKRSDLGLQVSLLAEHEITQLIKLVREMAEQMGIPQSKAPELRELMQDVAPERVLDRIEKHS